LIPTNVKVELETVEDVGGTRRLVGWSFAGQEGG
jgi:hypothetical protein